MPQSQVKFPPVAALVGDDTFLQLAGLAELLALLPPDTQRADVDGESAELADVLDEVRCFAMFGGGKAVIVRNGDAFLKRHRQQLEDYIGAPSDSAMLILRLDALLTTTRIHKLLTKSGRIVSCQPPKDAAPWIITRGKTAHKVAVAPEAARILADMIGNDLGRLDNELAKLALCCEGSTIVPRDIAGAVAFQRERDIWDLTNALAAGDSALAIRRWRQLVQLDSSAEFRAVTWLGMWLENVRKALAMVRRGESSFAIGQALRLWPREAQEPFIRTARAMGDAGLERTLDLLAEIDFQSKTGVGGAADNVERFILTMAAGARDSKAQAVYS